MDKWRREGYLKPLKTNRVPRRMIYFDTETTVPTKGGTQDTFNLILGVMIFVELDANSKITKREVYTFYEADDFIDKVYSLLPKRASITLFAHNIGFDCRVLDLMIKFNDRGWTSAPPIINERTFIWKVKTPRGGLTLLDTSNLGVLSTGSLGMDLDFPKLAIDFLMCTRAELEHYCTNDVLIIEKFVLQYMAYIQSNNLGGFRSTLAGQSMAAYRTRFLDFPPYIHMNEGALALERKGYHGGRVECFKIRHLKGEKFYYLDVNSMYPYAMTEDELPIKLIGYGLSPRLDYMKLRTKFYYCIADCDIDTDEPVYSYLKDGKLCFPIGKFRTVLYNPEIIYALERGHIKKVHSCAVYEKGYPFASYVDFFYNAKQEYTKQGNKSYRYISKLFLNSLYGKFGQLMPQRKPIGTTDFKGVFRLPLHNHDTGLSYQEIGWYGTVYLEYKEGETAISNPALAGAITAKARMRLWEFMTIAKLGNVYYIDTDSLIVNQSGYDYLEPYLDELKLGYLKLEKTAQNLHIYGNKDYIFGLEPKRKGISANAQVVAKNTWEYLQFEGFISWLNRGASGAPKGKYSTKQRRHIYNKGNVDLEGNVTPYLLV